MLRRSISLTERSTERNPTEDAIHYLTFATDGYQSQAGTTHASTHIAIQPVQSISSRIDDPEFSDHHPSMMNSLRSTTPSLSEPTTVTEKESRSISSPLSDSASRDTIYSPRGAFEGTASDG